MTLNSNSFGINNQKGRLVNLLNLNQLSCKIDVNETATLVPGDAVKLKDVASKIPVVEKITASTDIVFGFVPYSINKNEYVAGDDLQIAFTDCVMVMEASAAIAVGEKLQIDPSTVKVATKTGANSYIGIALEKATADTNLIKVLIKTISDRELDGLTSSVAELNILTGATLTTAELNLLDLSAQTETITSAGAVSVVKRVSKLALTGAGAVTLAVPDASMLGQIKVIEMTVDNGDVTLALTNIQGGSAGTTATFSAVGQTLTLVAGSGKWNVIGESGVVLS